MYYTKFEINNFKGIKSAEIEFGKGGGPRVFSLVGLNESGKTTVLEALHSFAPDSDVRTVVGDQRDIDEQRRQAVPRSRIADFTGRVSIKAYLKISEDDRVLVCRYLKDEQDITLDPNSLDEEFWYERYTEYKDGDLQGTYYETDLAPMVRTGKQRKYHRADQDEENYVANALRVHMPSIAYFPSFVFDFPQKIYLSPRPAGAKNAFYRRLFQDILDFGGRGHTIKDHITNRVRKEEFKIGFVGFIPTFRKSNEKQQIDQVIDHAARTVTSVVYEKWNEIFGEDTGAKEIVIDWEADAGKVYDSNTKSVVDSNEHDVYVEFLVKDGPDRFAIGTRSLGFRWFFSFLLFTQFRARRNTARPVLFLLDEPASNLHASAQQKLIDSFPEIVGNKHTLVYSTHSHYMIEPNWLEQAYVIQNDPSLAGRDVMATATLDDSSVDIRVSPYRRFVDQSPQALSYFQPIVDRLNVVPSKFDIDRAGVILEGKSDYYILEYFKAIEGRELPRLYPALGAGTLSALISLLRGWGHRVAIMLDSDAAGQKEKQRYIDDYMLTSNEITLLKDIDGTADKIEKLFSDEDRKRLAALVGKNKLSKKDMLLIFQEYLASSKKLPLESGTLQRAKKILDELENFHSV